MLTCDPSPAQVLIWFERLILEGTELNEEWHDLYDANAAWWTPSRARPILIARSGGVCECGCGEPLNFETAHVRHIFSRAQYRGLYSHSPANLALIRPDCHEAIHGRIGSGIDQERSRRLRNAALERLPPWFTSSKRLSRREKPKMARKRKKKPGALCSCGCGEPVGKRPIDGYRRSCWAGQ